MSVQKSNSQSKSTSSLNDQTAEKTAFPMIKDFDRVNNRLFKDLMTPSVNPLLSSTNGLKKDLSKAYFALSQETTESIMHPQDSGKWGYLKRSGPSTSKKLFIGAQMSKSKKEGGVVTCSQDEYMQLWLKNAQAQKDATRKESISGQIQFLPILDASQGIPTATSNNPKSTADAIAKPDDSKMHRRKHKRHHHHHRSKKSKETTVELGIDGTPVVEHKHRHRSGRRRPKSPKKTQTTEQEIFMEKLIPALFAEHKKNGHEPVIAPPLEPISARKDPVIQVPYKMQQTLPDGIQGQAYKMQEEIASSLPVRNGPVTSPDQGLSWKSPQATQLDMNAKSSAVIEPKDARRSSNSKLMVPSELDPGSSEVSVRSYRKDLETNTEQEKSALSVSNSDLAVPVGPRRLTLMQGVPVKPSASRRFSVGKVFSLLERY